jgi:hydrogenase expression/formation protein HypC
MCLAIPGRLVGWLNRDPLFAQAMVEFDGVARACHMACVPHAEVGDYVIVHAGIAISRLDEHEARRLLEEVSRLPDALEWREDAQPPQGDPDDWPARPTRRDAAGEHDDP